MTLAAIIATLVVVILQIITISLLRSTRKMVREFAAQKPVHSFQNDRRDRDVRQNNRRPGTDNRNRPQMPANTNNTTTAAVDPVEKSLRDINLKLKNAERDQEFARKKIQDNFSKDPNRRRDGGRGGRDQRRGDHRSNWNDRNSRRDNPRTPVESQNTNEIEEIKKPIEQQPIQEVSEVTTVAATTTVAPDLVPSDFGTEENMQHGRKFAPKRKFQSDENSIGASEQVQDQLPQEGPDNSEKAVESEIKFGRR